MAKQKDKKEKKQKLGPAFDIPDDLRARAKQIGLKDEQMFVFGSADKLKRYLDGISPQTNPDARVKEHVPEPAAKKEPRGVPSKVPALPDEQRADRDPIEHMIRLLNIKYDTPGLTFVTKIVRYDCSNKRIVSDEYSIEKG